MKIYVASKVWHAPLWVELRDRMASLSMSSSFDITSRWIDYADDSDIVQNRKGELWQHCLEDIAAADAMIIYCKDFKEEQRGVLVEAGHAMALGKPVICINTCKTFTPCGDLYTSSDCAFTRHPLFWWANPLQRPWERTSGPWWLDFNDGVDQAFERAVWLSLHTDAFDTIAVQH